MHCENCGSIHEGTFGSGRFCSKQCSKSFSTKCKRKEINSKVSETLSGRRLSEEHKLKIRLNTNFNGGRKKTSIQNILVENSSFNTNYVKSRLIKERIKEYVCEECGINSYMNKPIVLQLHHKNGNNKDHRLNNLQILCPNCHSQTDNWAGKNRSLRSSTG